MRPFVAGPTGYRAVLDAVEREVIASIVAEIVELLGSDLDVVPPDPEGATLLARAMTPASAVAPDDTAVRRLLPDASRDDAEVSQEFRRLTEGDLRDTKVRRLVAFRQLLRASEEHVVVARDAASDVAATLTDIRLVLADRLDLADDDRVEALYVELEDDEPGDLAAPEAAELAHRRRFLGSVYALLTYLQESLLTAMLRDLPRDLSRDGDR